MAGVSSTLPRPSDARAENVCGPSASVLLTNVDEHGIHSPASSLHSNDALGSDEDSSNTGEASLLSEAGPFAIMVSGPCEVTVNARVAGVSSVLPALSVARTAKVCSPLARPAIGCGDVQGTNAAASSLHSNVEPASLAEKVNDGGPPSIVVCGAIVSTVNSRVTGELSTFPTLSMARTANVCAPSASVVSVRGDVHAANCPSSSLHSNVEPGFVDVNANVGVLSLVAPVGPSANAVSGLTVSTVKVRVAGEGSTLPAASCARTENV